MFDPTAERSGGLPVYKKRGSDDAIWLEYKASYNWWQIKPTARKGTDSCSVSVVCSPPLQLPQSCNGKTWRMNSNDLTQIAVSEYTAAMEEADARALESLARQVMFLMVSNQNTVINCSI